jgi:hypothetical protein
MNRLAPFRDPRMGAGAAPAHARAGLRRSLSSPNGKPRHTRQTKHAPRRRGSATPNGDRVCAGPANATKSEGFLTPAIAKGYGFLPGRFSRGPRRVCLGSSGARRGGRPSRLKGRPSGQRSVSRAFRKEAPAPDRREALRPDASWNSKTISRLMLAAAPATKQELGKASPCSR